MMALNHRHKRPLLLLFISSNCHFMILPLPCCAGLTWTQGFYDTFINFHKIVHRMFETIVIMQSILKTIGIAILKSINKPFAVSSPFIDRFTYFSMQFHMNQSTLPNNRNGKIIGDRRTLTNKEIAIIFLEII